MVLPNREEFYRALRVLINEGNEARKSMYGNIIRISKRIGEYEDRKGRIATHLRFAKNKMREDYLKLLERMDDGLCLIYTPEYLSEEERRKTLSKLSGFGRDGVVRISNTLSIKSNNNSRKSFYDKLFSILDRLDGARSIMYYILKHSEDHQPRD